MQFDLDACCADSCVVIFDVASIRSPKEGEEVDVAREVERAAAAGEVIAYAEGSEEPSGLFRVLVNESPPDAWLERQENGVRGARLRMPSGRIMAATATDVWPNLTLSEYSTQSIEPGDYLVDAFRVRWSEEEKRHAMRSRVSAVQSWLRGAGIVMGGVGGAGILGGLLAALAGLFEQTWIPIKVAGVMLIPYWAVTGTFLLVLAKSGVFRRVSAAEEAVQKEQPDLVVWLRPIAGERDFSAGKFGSWATDPSAPKAKKSGMTKAGCVGAGLLLLLICFLVALPIALVTTWVSGNW